MKDQMNALPVSGLKPEAIPLNVKIILVGTPDIYHLLYEADDDFSKLFKVKVEFEEEMDNTDANRKKIAAFVSSFCEKDKALPFTPSGVAAVHPFGQFLWKSATLLFLKCMEFQQFPPLAQRVSWYCGRFDR